MGFFSTMFGSSSEPASSFGSLKDIAIRYKGRWEGSDYIDPEGYRYENWKITCGIGSGAGACMFYFGYKPNNTYPDADGLRCDGYCAYKKEYDGNVVIKDRGERGEAAGCQYWVPRSFSEGDSQDDDIRKHVERIYLGK